MSDLTWETKAQFPEDDDSERRAVVISEHEMNTLRLNVFPTSFDIVTAICLRWEHDHVRPY